MADTQRLYTFGNELMLLVGDKVLGWCTNNSFSMSMSTTEISTKDHGEAAAVIGNSYSWSVTTENLFSADADALRDACAKRKLVTVVFAKPGNYNDKGLQRAQAEGSTATGLPTDWDMSNSTYTFAQGSGYVTSLDVNAAAGENATFSATITGSGSLTNIEEDEGDNTQGGGN